MFTLPFVAFFAVRHCSLEYTDWPEIGANALSVFSSVVTIYIIIGTYSWHAYHNAAKSSETTEEAANEDKKKK